MASNFERFLWWRLDGDGAAVRSLHVRLRCEGRGSARNGDGSARRGSDRTRVGPSGPRPQTLATIERWYRKYGPGPRSAHRGGGEGGRGAARRRPHRVPRDRPSGEVSGYGAARGGTSTTRGSRGSTNFPPARSWCRTTRSGWPGTSSPSAPEDRARRERRPGRGRPGRGRPGRGRPGRGRPGRGRPVDAAPGAGGTDRGRPGQPIAHSGKGENMDLGLKRQGRDHHRRQRGDRQGVGPAGSARRERRSPSSHRRAGRAGAGRRGHPGPHRRRGAGRGGGRVPATRTSGGWCPTTVEHFGGIDILVNNAGGSRAHPFLEATEGDLARGPRDQGVRGDPVLAARCCRTFAPSGAGPHHQHDDPRRKGAPRKNALPTSASRALGINLTKAMANEYAPENILVNTICLGLIRSAQHERRWERERPRRGDPRGLLRIGWERTCRSDATAKPQEVGGPRRLPRFRPGRLHRRHRRSTSTAGRARRCECRGVRAGLRTARTEGVRPDVDPRDSCRAKPPFRKGAANHWRTPDLEAGRSRAGSGRSPVSMKKSGEATGRLAGRRLV